MRSIKLLIQWLVLMAFLWPPILFAQTVTLKSLEATPKNQSWNLNFTAPQAIEAKYFFLTNPNRLVIDISHASIFKNEISSQTISQSPFEKIRYSSQPGQQMRIVLDLKKSLQVSALNHSNAKTYQQLQIILKESILAAPKPHALDRAVVMPATKHPRLIVVVIDPGHGGKDPGAIGLNKLNEKDIVLNIAKKLQILINQQPGFKAVLTRDNDYYLTLRERLAIARKNKADMFIAIHADAYSDHAAHGVSIFALSNRGATSEAARWLAARENQSELMGGVDLPDKENILRSVLINLSQNATIQASLLIGQDMLDNIHPFAHLHHSRLEQAAFVVLKSPDIPSLLIETGFLSNGQEENKLSDHGYQQNLAKAMMLGIKNYFVQRPPPDTWLAAQDNRHKDG